MTCFKVLIMPVFRIVILLLPVVLLNTGCDPLAKPETMMDEYVKRLGYVLEVEPRYSDQIPTTRLPRPRERRLPVAEADINLLDFLSLYGCELQFVIGEKNSIMGRVMQPLNRLRYEVRFIEAARDCLPEIDDESLRQTLLEAIETKQQNLPVVIWNGTWGTDEIAQLMSLSNGLFQPEKSQHEIFLLSEDIHYLNQVIRQLYQGAYDQEMGYLGEIQQRWQYGSRAGQLQNSGRLLISRLDDATQILHQRIQHEPLCRQGKPNTQARQLEAMFFSVYIDKVQPYLAAISQRSEQLFDPLAELAQLQETVMPDPFTDYYSTTLSLNHPDSMWVILNTRIKEHTTAWQDLLEQCGLRPSA